MGAGDPQGLQAARARAEAEGIIRHVHDYCGHVCSRWSDCAGEACNLYRKEQEARDTLTRLSDAELVSYADVPTSPSGLPVIG